jgi:hypothetical protein
MPSRRHRRRPRPRDYANEGAGGTKSLSVVAVPWWLSCCRKRVETRWFPHCPGIFRHEVPSIMLQHPESDASW